MSRFTLTYKTSMTAADCMQKILAEPWEYEDEDMMFGKLWYRCEQISETQLHVTFTGGSRRKAKGTKFLLELEPAGGTTKITICFVSELLGLTLPLTTVKEIDMFMSRRIQASQYPLGQEFRYT